MSYIGNEPIVSATRTITEIAATAGQTVFVANGGYTVGYIDVFVNGAQLQTSDFTATNGSSITLISPATTGDDIRLVAWGTFTTSSSYTQAQADALLATKLNTSTNVAFKNRILNGDMRIDQRNAGASVTPTDGAYTLDRWKMLMFNSASKYTVQQNAGSVTPPVGQRNYLGITSTSSYSLAASDLYGMQQRIEGFNTADLDWGTANAKTVTLSFWVRSSLTGTFGGSIQNSAGNRSYPFSYTINSASTWEYKTITIAGDTSGTWVGATNGIGLVVYLMIGTGSTFSGTAGAWAAGERYAPTGATSVVGTNGATFYITGVQLEVGSSATPFDTRAYGTELALCQRYYQEYNAAESAAAGGGSVGVCGTTSIAVMSGILPVEMRATPSFNFNNIVINFGGGTVAVTTTAGFYSGRKAIGMDLTVSGTPLTVGRAAVLQFSGGQSAANKWFLTAEL